MAKLDTSVGNEEANVKKKRKEKIDMATMHQSCYRREALPTAQACSAAPKPTTQPFSLIPVRKYHTELTHSSALVTIAIALLVGS